MTPQALFYKIVRYEVPPFQRRYIWTQAQQWEPLWEDLSNQAEAILEDGRTDPHFMGAIVLQQRFNPSGGIETRIVVDGQQRLTTLQLLIDAVQEVFEQRGHSQPASRLAALVQNHEAFLSGLMDPNVAFKVWPTINDQAAFRQAMRNDLASDKFKRSSIVEAHNYFKNQTEQWLYAFPEEGGQREEAAGALDDALRNYLELVVMDMTQSDDPHIIFETLNARGTPLLPSDMIKNQILYKAGISSDEGDDQLPEEADRLWGFSEDWWSQEIGRGYQRRPRIDVFLNNWLTLRNQSETKAHNEFAVFSNYVEKSEECGTSIQSVATDIGRLGDIYRSIEELRLPSLGTFLYRRRVMGIGVVVPTLLWLLSSEVPSQQLSRSITALESYLVRRMACGMGARSYGQLFVGLIQELESSGPSSAGDVVVRHLARQTAFANQWPDDQTMLDRFITAPLYWSLTRGRLNLILQGIEGELRRDAMPETQEVPRGLHIEHVMPQVWHPQNWPLPADTVDQDEAIANRNRMIHSIGNLTLVNQRLNSTLSNDPWSKKRVTLDKHTTLFLNKNMLDNAPDCWDEKAIQKRARELCKIAIKVWPHADNI